MQYNRWMKILALVLALTLVVPMSVALAQGDNQEPDAYRSTRSGSLECDRRHCYRGKLHGGADHRRHGGALQR